MAYLLLRSSTPMATDPCLLPMLGQAPRIPPPPPPPPPILPPPPLRPPLLSHPKRPREEKSPLEEEEEEEEEEEDRDLGASFDFLKRQATLDFPYTLSMHSWNKKRLPFQQLQKFSSRSLRYYGIASLVTLVKTHVESQQN